MFSHALENPFCYYGATIVNFNRTGMGFESDYYVPPGSVILVRFVEKGNWSLQTDPSEMRVVDVIWCHSVTINNATVYCFGGRLLPQGKKEPVMDPTHLLHEELGEGKWKEILGRFDTSSSEGMSALKALEKAKEAAEIRAQHLSILNRFAAIITSTLEFNDILQTICREMVEIFNSRNVGIGLLNQHGTDLRIVAFHAGDPSESDATGIIIPIADNDATRFVIETRQSIIVPDVQRNPLTASYRDLAIARGTDYLMIVPLMTKNKVIGTIGLPTTDAKPTFTPDQVLLAQTIASQISGAIENARLYKQTVIAKNLAEKELEIGRQIQTSFLPEVLPVCEGWEFDGHFSPAGQVAGDFYDMVPLGECSKVGLVLGDVCDKGVGAALFMALFRSLIRAFLTQSIQKSIYQKEFKSIDDDALLLRTAVLVNDYIATVHGSTDMFATIFLGLLDLDTGKLLYVNGGHEPPLICRSKGIRTTLPPTGPAIGLLPGINITVAQERLGHGETLVAVTDGVTEAENADGRFFTRQRLESLLEVELDSAAGAIDAIVREVNAHLGDMDQFDDITMLAVRRMQKDG